MVTVYLKKCTKCYIEKDHILFSKSKKGKFGVGSVCKECSKNEYLNDREKVIARVRAYTHKNRELIAIKSKDRYEKNREIMLLRIAKYAHNNKEKKAEYDKRYRQINKDRITSTRKSSPEYKLCVQAYRRSEMGKASIKNSNNKRRATIKNGNIVTKDILDLLKNTKHCYWCRSVLIKSDTHLDHYLPLSKGGEHIISNLVVSCKQCNLRKHAKDPIYFANSIGKLF